MLPEPKLYVWDVFKDTVEYFDFEKGILSSEEDDVSFNPPEENCDSEKEVSHPKARRSVFGFRKEFSFGLGLFLEIKPAIIWSWLEANKTKFPNTLIFLLRSSERNSLSKL